MSNKHLEDIQSLFTSFDFATKNVTLSDTSVEFTLLSYEQIDGDYDYDEAHYEKITDEFMRQLYRICSEKNKQDLEPFIVKKHTTAFDEHVTIETVNGKRKTTTIFTEI